jgi:hypothetical protein
MYTSSPCRCQGKQRLAQRPAGIHNRILSEQGGQVDAGHDRVFRITRLDEPVQVTDHEQPATFAGVCRQHLLKVSRHQLTRGLVAAKPYAQCGTQVACGRAQHQRGLVVGQLDRAVTAG